MLFMDLHNFPFLIFMVIKRYVRLPTVLTNLSPKYKYEVLSSKSQSKVRIMDKGICKIPHKLTRYTGSWGSTTYQEEEPVLFRSQSGQIPQGINDELPKFANGILTNR